MGFHCMDKNTKEVNGKQTCLITNILQNIFYYVPQKKVRHEIESGDFHFWVDKLSNYTMHILSK